MEFTTKMFLSLEFKYLVASDRPLHSSRKFAICYMYVHHKTFIGIGHETYIGIGHETFIGIGHETFIGIGHETFIGIGHETFIGIGQEDMTLCGIRDQVIVLSACSWINSSRQPSALSLSYCNWLKQL